MRSLAVAVITMVSSFTLQTMSHANEPGAGRYTHDEHQRTDDPNQDAEPWLKVMDPSDPAVPVPVVELSAAYFPYKKGIVHRRVETLYKPDGSFSNRTTVRLSFDGDGVMTKSVTGIELPGGLKLDGPTGDAEKHFYQLKDGYLLLGRSEDAKNPQARIKWKRVMKIGAKVGERWGEYPHVEGANRTFARAGTYRKEPCVVITQENGWYLFVKGKGLVMERFYSIHDGRKTLVLETVAE